MKNILLLLLLPVLASAQTELNFHGLVPFTVTSVFDGDGFKGQYLTGKKDEIRLLDLDTPEKRGFSSIAQAYGNEAGDSLRAMIKGRLIYLDTLTMKGENQRDQFGRLLVIAYLEDATNINYEIVARGWGWAQRQSHTRLPKFNDVLKNAQREARVAKRGFWAGKKPYRPELHRKRYNIFK